MQRSKSGRYGKPEVTCVYFPSIHTFQILSIQWLWEGETKIGTYEPY